MVRYVGDSEYGRLRTGKAKRSNQNASERTLGAMETEFLIPDLSLREIRGFEHVPTEDLPIKYVWVNAGDTVRPRDLLVTIEAEAEDKLASWDIIASDAGVVGAVMVKEGDRVSTGTPLLTMLVAGDAAEPVRPTALLEVEEGASAESPRALKIQLAAEKRLTVRPAVGAEAAGRDLVDRSATPSKLLGPQRGLLLLMVRGPMNQKQRRVLFLAAAAIALTLLFPPLIESVGYGRTFNCGYGFLLDLPRSCTVDSSLLLTQWLAVFIVAGILWFVSRDKG